MASKEISKNFRLLNSLPLDAWYGPYETVADACLAVPSEIRLGKVVGITTPSGLQDYWWNDSILDSGLKAKVVSGPQGIQGVQGIRGIAGPQGLQGITGPRGLKGDSFNPDATGLEAERYLHDGETIGFSYLSTDTSLVYFKYLSGWSLGVPFGTASNDTPISMIPKILEIEDEEVLLDWNSDLILKHGIRPVSIQLYERTNGAFIKSTSPDSTSDEGTTYRWYVGQYSSRVWEIRVIGYTEVEAPIPPIITTPIAPTDGFVNTISYTFSFQAVDSI